MRVSLALFATALSAAACRRGRTTSAALGTDADTVEIGVAVGLQSPERYVNVFRGVQIALDELNASRPDGTPVLMLRRAPAEARSAVEVAAAFRDDPRVVGVVGHTESEATIDAAAVYADRANGGKRALVAVTPTAIGTYVTRVSDWVFRVCPVGSQEGRYLARFAVDSLHLTRVALVYRNDAMGKDFLREFGAELAARGGTVVEADPFMEEIPQFAEPYAERIARSRVQGVVLVGNAPEALKLIRALRAQKVAPVVMGTNPPAPVDGESAISRDFAGMRYITLYVAERPLTEAGARFARTFEQQTGTRADHWSALGYDAAMLIGNAVHEAGPDRRRVRDWIAGVGRDRPAFSGATGEIRFDRGGDPVDKPMVVEEARLP